MSASDREIDAMQGKVTTIVDTEIFYIQSVAIRMAGLGTPADVIPGAVMGGRGYFHEKEKLSFKSGPKDQRVTEMVGLPCGSSSRVTGVSGVVVGQWASTVNVMGAELIGRSHSNSSSRAGAVN